MTAKGPLPFGVALGPAAVALAFLPIHFVVAWIGTELTVEAPSASAFWPAAGTLTAALLLYPHRYWPGIALAAWVAEFAAFTVPFTTFAPATAAFVATVNLAQCALAAYLVRRFAGERVNFSRIRTALVTTLALALAMFAGGIVGGFAVNEGETFIEYWANRQMWSLSSFLGALALVPLIVTYARHGLRPNPARGPVSRPYVALQFATLVAVLVFIFSRDTTRTTFALDSPALVYAVLLWIVADCGPRRIATALFLVVAITTGFTLAGTGSFGILLATPTLATLKLQGFLAIVIAPLFILQAVITERRDAWRVARAHEQRYRSFIAQSSEAIFRAELSKPMPVTLPAAAQREWLERHLFVAECNAAFHASATGGDGAAGVAGDASSLGGPRPVWLRECLSLVPRVLAEGGRLENVECRLPGPYGLDRSYLVSLSAVVEDGTLRRLWGVARDVSRLRAVLEQLEHQERELRALATELTLAEERTRRRIAADLHDGIAQSLAGLAMQIAAVRRAAELGQPLPDLAVPELVLAESLAQIRALMTELQPPGLYDQGIVAGLRWHIEQFTARTRVRVEYEDDGAAKPLDEPTTVLVYQAARQLLQNAARHSRCAAVSVRTATVDGRLVLSVTDSGVGFTVSDVTFRPTRQGGFGLFSIRERLRMIGGTLEIESTPGHGTRVHVTAPLAGQRDLFGLARSA
jgi:signal transduction histidine kinase